ncbi:MAG: 3-dehydroquinate synthase [Muribaculaceae bacterium]|nr:3-dehydroquinate synthase [Muribaculaceae bacterium]
MNPDTSRIIETTDLATALKCRVAACRDRDRTHLGPMFILTDNNVEKLVLPALMPWVESHNVKIITIEPGEKNKNLQTLTHIWESLSNEGATRSSLLINLGGGVVTDIGGFAAATFKRGIRYVNIPTTVLGAVDAAVGGKTAIDFNGLKNEIGAFHQPEAVVISPLPLRTLPPDQTASGFAEIVKTSLISSKEFYHRCLRADIDNPEELFPLIVEAVRFKERVTDEDPHEKGLRKILNFGHTAGHAFETWMMRRGTPISHGEAVANGILVALILSHTQLGLPSAEIHTYATNILKPYFRGVPILCKDYPDLLDIMGHDKKNHTAGDIRFVLLNEIGIPGTDISIPAKEIEAALDIYRDLL